MSITVLVELKIRKDMADAYAARLVSVFPETRAFAGCVDIVAYRDEATPERIVLIERWQSRDHYDRYIQFRREQGVFERLATIIDEPMKVSFLRAVTWRDAGRASLPEDSGL